MKRIRWLLGIGGLIVVLIMLVTQLGAGQGASLLTGPAAAAPLSSQRAVVRNDKMGSTTPATPTSPPTESPCASCTLTPSPSVQTIPPRPTPPAGTSSLSPGPSTPFVVTPTPAGQLATGSTTPTSPPTESPCASCTLTPSPPVQTIPPRPTPPAGTSSLSPGPSTPFVVTPTPAALPATGGSPLANGVSNWMIVIAGLAVAMGLVPLAWLYARRVR